MPRFKVERLLNQGALEALPNALPRTRQADPAAMQTRQDEGPHYAAPLTGSPRS